MSVKTDALRRIASAIDNGAPKPNNITYYTQTVEVLVLNEDQWLAWVDALGGAPSDSVRDDRYPGEHKPTVSWSDGHVLVKYLDAMTEVSEVCSCITGPAHPESDHR